MALSNIFNEPRREITESVVGTLVFSGFLPLDYFLALGFEKITGGAGHGGCPWPLGMLFFVPVGLALAIAVFVYLPHFLGEVFCGWLANAGLEVRPNDRTGRR